MDFLREEHLSEITFSVPTMEKQITDVDKYKVVTKSKILSLENDVIFF